MDDDIFRLYEDRRGDVWIATVDASRNGLMRWERATETFHDYSRAAAEAFHSYSTGAAAASSLILATAFCEDSSGNLWIGFNGGLLRYAADRFEYFDDATGAQDAEAPWVLALHLDQYGRLWVGVGSNGLIRADDPAADRPRFRQYTTRDGLASNEVS